MNINVLFVDDDPNVIRGLKRMLHQLRKKWSLYFAESGEEALRILDKNKIDVIVSDMRMPKMDGAELLSKVKEIHPEVVRIILSGHSDKEMALNSTIAAHQFLAKPCDSEKIKSTIQKTFNLRHKLKNKKLLKIITGIGILPTLPDVYLKIEKEMAAKDYSIKRIGEIISTDISISAKILQLVNSSFFGHSMKITNPEQAVSYLGTKIIKSLILQMSVFSFYNISPEHKMFLDSLWSHSIGVGNNAKKIIRSESSKKHALDDAYIAGILHDVGKISLLQVPDYYENIYSFLIGKNIHFSLAEHELLGTTHAEVGACLLSLWGFSHSVVEAVAYHHNPSDLGGDENPILTAVHLANTFTNISNLDAKYLKNLGIDNKLFHYIDCCR